MADKKNIIIDCDPGIDDALSLLLAFSAGNINVKAVTSVFGNVDVDKATENIIRLYDLAGKRKCPRTGKGAAESLAGMGYKPRFVHGADGLGNTNLPLPDKKVEIEDGFELIRDVLAEGDVDEVVALGPLTNIASILVEEPVLKEKIKQITVMGGAVFTSGNATESAEFNFYQDPEAAKVVLNAKVPIKLISLDATRKILYSRQTLAKIKKSKSSKLAELVNGMIEFSLDYYKKYLKRDGLYLPDVLAMCAVIDEQIGEYKNISLDVDIEKERGKVFDNLDAANTILYLEEIDKNRVMDMLINGLNSYIT